ncbi:putative baseplate assembly protein [Cohnella caldifontis]|uniref:putative baseplate assembly protein n=1 Tax=Cohnella caldifontis TaxID=3027471 RepID=UPI0023ED2AC5|nr:putative baseplate assembly protein [Cohnella sp. YIM B05605]
MLPRLPLDDRNFAGLMQEARRGIPQRFPEWTDENAHDPGITMLELFAWLSEMQQFYLSRIPERNLRKFLDLLRVTPREAVSAETVAVIGQVKEPLMLPAGSKLLAEDQIFETAEAVRLLPLSIDRIVTRTEREVGDRTASNTGGRSAFYAFGPDASAGSAMYVAFDREPEPGETIALSVRLADDADGEAAPDRSMVVPSAKVVWRAYALEEGAQAASWIELQPELDETLHLSYGGRVSFRLTRPMKPVVVHPAADKPRYWISCTVEEPGYERPPRIDRLLLNTVKVRQQNTLSETREFDSPGTPGFTLETEGYLARYGRLTVQVREADGRWRDWRETSDLGEAGPGDRRFAVSRGGVAGAAVIRFGDGEHGAVPPEGTANIRLIAIEPEFEALSLFGRSNGLPNQIFRLYDVPCRWSDGLRIQVGVPDGDEWVWEDWQSVGGFDRSGPLDRHFTYRPDTGELRFGDDERGAIPSAHDSPNLRIIACRLGGGERGNIKPGLLTQWVSPEQRALGLTVTNPGYASGGTEGETLQACLERAADEWRTPYCAVTDEDYARIAKSTPGLRVARVHVIPDFAPGKPESPGAVTVVVVPEGSGLTPKPSRGFLATVARHLDDRRMITTELYTAAPEYIRVTVHAVVVVEPHFMDEAHRIAAALNRLLSPLDRPAEGIEGWPFGRTVYKGDIYGAIGRIKGVAYVLDLWLDAEGRYARKNAGGDIQLPPNGLVYSGRHRIELLSRTQV